jgi:nitrogen regulatory protein PII
VERTVAAIIEANKTGSAGDGKIFVMPVLEATRVRTGETVHGPAGGGVLDSSGGLE